MPIHKLKLISRREVAKNTLVVEFAKPDLFTFAPGQYGGFTLIDPPEIDAGGITRRFSLLGTPDDESIAIATRIQTSAFKRVLKELPLGSEIKFAGPSGIFTLHEDASQPAVFIAGGIGIVPFYSMVKHAVKHCPHREIFLFYGNQTIADAAFLDELSALQNQCPRFTLINTMAVPSDNWQGEKGFITDTLIKKYIHDLSKPIYYVCGSPAMVSALYETLKGSGINETHIRVEDFPGY